MSDLVKYSPNGQWQLEVLSKGQHQAKATDADGKSHYSFTDAETGPETNIDGNHHYDIHYRGKPAGEVSITHGAHTAACDLKAPHGQNLEHIESQARKHHVGLGRP